MLDPGSHPTTWFLDPYCKPGTQLLPKHGDFSQFQFCPRRLQPIVPLAKVEHGLQQCVAIGCNNEHTHHLVWCRVVLSVLPVGRHPSRWRRCDGREALQVRTGFLTIILLYCLQLWCLLSRHTVLLRQIEWVLRERRQTLTGPWPE